MYLLESFIIAMSMYSKIPMPRAEWNEKNMKYALCFFPVVGVVIGFFEILAGWVLLKCGVGRLFLGAVMTLIPLVISGGIHMDGFMDTMDALSSYGDREKKLSILKDPHAGAFAIIGFGCYVLFSAALFSEADADTFLLIGIGFVVSRALSGLSVVTFPAAKDSGLVRTFQDGAQKKKVGIIMCGWFFASALTAIAVGRTEGVAAVLAALIVFAYYKRMSSREFGGITGDLAGYFLQVCELSVLAVTVLTGRFV